MSHTPFSLLTRPRRVVTGACTLALLLSGTLVARTATADSARSSAASAAGVNVHGSSLGTLLVNHNGFTLYIFSRDSRGRDRCAATPGCMGVWPALTTRARPHAGHGVRASLLGTIALGGGRRQVTYAGHPLYTYAFDSGPAETGYVGATQFGGTWRALSATGRPLG